MINVNLLEQGRPGSQEDEVVLLDSSDVQSPSPLLHESPLLVGGPHRKPRFRWQTIAGGFAFVLATLALVIHFTFSALSPKVGGAPPPPPLPPPVIASSSKLILLSIDGARPEYFARSLTPVFTQWEEDGTKTFPNHYTIVTGLFPESHGIVGNQFFDPVWNETFDYHSNISNSDAKWWGGEPIWATTVKHHKKAATCFYPGSEAMIQNVRPNIWIPYAQASSMSTNDRIDVVLSWLDLPRSEQPDIMLLYFSLIDTNGHGYGPYSKQVNDSLVEINQGVERLMVGIRARKMESTVNILAVSDHGMAATDSHKVVKLHEILAEDDAVLLDGSPVIHVFPKKPENIPAILEKLLKASIGQSWKVYTKDQIPDDYHYRNNVRIAPILVVAEIPLYLETARDEWFLQGAHGYNRREPDMHGIFYARGPNFRSSKELTKSRSLDAAYRIPSFENYELYNIMAKIMGVPAAPNNGTPGGLSTILDAMR